MAHDDVDRGILNPNALTAPWTQGEVAHLAFDAARHHAMAATADRDRAHFRQDALTRCDAWRGERPRRGAACGGRRSAYA